MARKRLNLTVVVVEEDHLRESQAMAVDRESRRHAAWERIQPLLDHPAVHLGRPRASRDNLHER
jgi:hypothetical protein